MHVNSICSYTCGTLSHEDTGNFAYAGLGCVPTAGVSVHLSRGCVFSRLEKEGKCRESLDHVSSCMLYKKCYSEVEKQIMFLILLTKYLVIGILI